MKTQVSRLVALFFALMVIAQTAHAQTIPSTVQRSRALRSLEHLTAAKTAATYKPLETINLTWQDQDWINDTRTRNLYQGGLLRQQYQDTWDGNAIGVWHEATLTEYAYADGILSQTTTYERSDAGWVGLTQTAYSSQNGLVIQIIDEVYQDGAWVNYERTSLAITDGYITDGLTETWTGTEWASVERFKLIEENDGVVESMQTWTGSAWENSERFVYSGLTIAQLYDQLERFTSDFSDYEGMYYSLRLPDVLTQQWDAGAWVDVSRQTSNRWYDVNGIMLKEEITTDAWAEGAWLPSFRIVIDYVQIMPFKVMPANTSFQVHDGAAWTDLFVETYVIQTDILRIVQATLQADLGAGLQETSRIRIDWGDIATSTEPAAEIPRGFELDQNYPNPFNPSTRIVFRLSEPHHVRLAVYNLLGREVAVLEDGIRPSGEHTSHWEATDMPSGLYLYRLEAGTHSQTRQMVLLK